MKRFFAPNISRAGRIVRAVWGVVLIAASVVLWRQVRWASLVLIGAGIFALYEAIRGWCLMRACGIKTKL